MRINGLCCFVVNGKDCVGPATGGVSFVQRRYRHIIAVTEIFDISFLFADRKAAHSNPANVRERLGGEGNPQQIRRCAGILPVNLKEVPNLIKHDVVRVGCFHIVVGKIILNGCLRLRPGLQNGVVSRLFLRRQVMAIRDQGLDPFGHLLPGELHRRTVCLAKTLSTGFVGFLAPGRSGECMASAACAVFFFQEIGFLFRGMRSKEEVIDTLLASGKAAAAGNRGVDFIFCNKGGYFRKRRHACGELPSWET